MITSVKQAYPPWLVEDVLRGLPDLSGDPAVGELPRPAYDPFPRDGRPGRDIGLAVKSMADHMTDEGWQLFLGLHAGGYELEGFGLGKSRTDVAEILRGSFVEPRTVVMQDKREWDAGSVRRDFRDPRDRFTNVECLADRHDIFKLTVLKDAQARPWYHRQSAAEIGCHAWVTYYHPAVVKRLAPYVRAKDLVRTWHTLDAMTLPPFVPRKLRAPVAFSGAVSDAYPLRKRIAAAWDSTFAGIGEWRRHPGYHRRGSATPDYLQWLSGFKVAICTASRFGYALRKIIEAVACGCRVVTDLPADECLPGIDGELVRVHPSISMDDLRAVCIREAETWDDRMQRWASADAVAVYDWRVEGPRLAAAIEARRLAYNADD